MQNKAQQNAPWASKKPNQETKSRGSRKGLPHARTPADDRKATLYINAQPITTDYARQAMVKGRDTTQKIESGTDILT